MPSFRDFFKPKPRSKSAPPAARHTWARIRRSQSAGAPLTNEPQPTAEDEDEEIQSTQGGQDGAGDSASLHGTEEQGTDDGSPLERQVSTMPRTSHPLHESSDQSQPQNGSQRESNGGSKRLKGFMSRFRLSRSQDRSSASEALQPSIPQDAAQDSMTTDPVKRDTPPQQLLTGEQEAEMHEQNRNVSAQTAQSQDSNVTVYRHPSQRVPMAVHELQEDVFWSSLLNFEKEIPPSPILPIAPPPSMDLSHNVEPSHPVESSDPFSDGKNIEPPRHHAMPSSKYSGDRSQRQSEASVHTQVQGVQSEPLSKSSSKSTKCSNCRRNASDSGITSTRASSATSHGSRTSRLSQVDQSKAAAAFDALATKLGISLSLREEETPVAAAEPAEDESDNQARRRHRFGRVRPTQSHSTLAPTHSPAKLRRSKTFASLAHRSSPMSSLRGRSIEDIARLGGHSFLILPFYLAPTALQLPACIVAMVMYLRRAFSGPPPYPPVFEDPGDIRAATRLYNHFASQVLLPERDAHRIAMTMRVVALPNIETESNSAAILSVGWVFMQILGGLPNGILGSVRLFRVLHVISLRGPNPDSDHIRLITLAIMGLTSEMQCSLICGVFGFFNLLLQRTENVQESTNQKPGNSVRPVASYIPLQLGRLARVFAPLLIGRREVKRSVEEEIEEERVMEFLLAHWPRICRQLWDWTASSRNRRE
ncbi:hypothetical protein N7488_011204 [Penicillium malachiteum]|nr:hypothetical protein N7488_011204 [Penicillium malachiteum]